MVFSTTLIVAKMHMPKPRRIGVLLDIRVDTKDIRIRSKRRTCSFSVTRRCSAVNMMPDSW